MQYSFDRQEHPADLKPQWGFRPERSAVTALLSVLHEWFLTLEDGNEVCAIFLDYKKAFDIIPHRPLLDKLMYLGFNEYILRWVTSYLTCRSQRVVVNGESSSQVPVVSGVPQGSVLGPLLFIIYINDLAECNFCSGSKLVMYADDVLLYRNILRAEDYVSLQADLNTVDEWSSSNYLQFNLSKCKYMVMSRKKNVSSPPTPFTLSGHLFDRVYSFKYLGVLIAYDLTWYSHTKMVCDKARKLLGLLYRKFYDASAGTLCQLYLSMVRPHLEYASPVWSPHLAKDMELIEGVQKFALRIASKSWTMTYHDLLGKFNIHTLETRSM